MSVSNEKGSDWLEWNRDEKRGRKKYLGEWKAPQENEKEKEKVTQEEEGEKVTYEKEKVTQENEKVHRKNEDEESYPEKRKRVTHKN